ncbi:MAG TPA: CoA transferase [Dehalococcoidia bacterium]|nr:CoA transferase [Dehalococcoidia bacterium]
MAQTKPIGEGVRVLDLGMFWAGPTCTSLLADAGMEVIKIEACRHPDPDRITPQGLAYVNNDPGQDPWNRGLVALRRHRNKLGCTLDLTTPEGRDLFIKLVRISDVVVENFRLGVMERWGLGYSALQRENSQIIMVSVSSSGNTGPEREYGSNAPIVACLGGLLSITGYTDEASLFVDITTPDPLAGTLAAGLVMAGLRYRKHTGKGLNIVLSQRELVTNIIGEFIMDYFMNQRIAGPSGNRHPYMAPHGCYPCKDEDSWITLAIRNNEEWLRFCQVLGVPELASDPRFADGVARWHHQDDLDSIIASLSRSYPPHELMGRLQREGIAAGVVQTARDVVNDPHLASRGFWETVSHPRFGPHAFKGRGFYFSKSPVGTRSPAPCLGEHNSYVFGELLGLSPEEIARLEEKAVIGTVPSLEVRGRIPSLRSGVNP